MMKLESPKEQPPAMRSKINVVSLIIEIDSKMLLQVLGMIITVDLVKGQCLIDTIRVFRMMT